MKKEVATDVFIWEIHLMGSYYDNDPRMPGTVPVDDRIYVIGKDYDEVLEKAKKKIDKFKKEYKKDSEISVSIIPTQNLIVVRDSKKDGRLGFYSTQNYQKVELSMSDEYELSIQILKKPAPLI